jgi:hypothetical protein
MHSNMIIKLLMYRTTIHKEHMRMLLPTQVQLCHPSHLRCSSDNCQHQRGSTRDTNPRPQTQQEDNLCVRHASIVRETHHGIKWAAMKAKQVVDCDAKASCLSSLWSSTPHGLAFMHRNEDIVVDWRLLLLNSSMYHGLSPPSWPCSLLFHVAYISSCNPLPLSLSNKASLLSLAFHRLLSLQVRTRRSP